MQRLPERTVHGSLKPSMHRSLLACGLACATALLCAQTALTAQTRRTVATSAATSAVATIHQPVDSTPAARAAGEHADVSVHVSLDERRLWVLSGNDTLRAASIAVATTRELRFGNRAWKFYTPRGRHVVLSKRADPLWRPPDWHYAEAALENGWKMRTLPAAGVTLPDGRRVLMQGNRAGLILPGEAHFLPLPVNEHIVFDSTLYIPPLGSRNREIAGELGRYALYIGDGYLLHGTPDQSSVGNAITHGCLRLLDEDIAWLFHNVPVGAVVIIR